MTTNTVITTPILDNTEIPGQSWVTLGPTDEATFEMTWHDGVVNEFRFEHELLSVVLMRLATLVYCGEFDFHAGFATDNDEANAAALAFLKASTTPPNYDRYTWHGGPAKPKITYSPGVDRDWRLWIPPTSLYCYEGAVHHGAIVAPWGDTFHVSHAAACEFLGQAVLEGKVG